MNPLPTPEAIAATDVPLYDVDFEFPPHTSGQPPVTGAGGFPRDTPTSVFGNDIAITGSVDQHLEFLGVATPQFSQFVGFALDRGPYEEIRIRLELQPVSLASTAEARLLVDTPQSNSVQFRFNGDIEVFDADLSGEIVGSYSVGAALLVTIDLDLTLGRWSIDVDGSELHAGSLQGDLTTWTFRIGSFGNDFDIRVDDVLITQLLPSPVPALTRTPRLVLLLGMGVAGALVLFRKVTPAP